MKSMIVDKKYVYAYDMLTTELNDAWDNFRNRIKEIDRYE